MSNNKSQKNIVTIGKMVNGKAGLVAPAGVDINTDFHVGEMYDVEYAAYYAETLESQIKALFPDGIPDENLKQLVDHICKNQKITDDKKIRAINKAKENYESGVLDKWLSRGDKISSIVSNIINLVNY
ncbi:hypothetical protein ACLZTU_23580 [Raoultella ornithinolytica]|uniref:hypothetical protein n=1 Tax=Raoultella ornithinolytica TaxID=54291 RepID=UPI0039B3F610